VVDAVFRDFTISVREALLKSYIGKLNRSTAQSKAQKPQIAVNASGRIRDWVKEIEEILMRASLLIEPEVLALLMTIRANMEWVTAIDLRADFDIEPEAEIYIPIIANTKLLQNCRKTKSDPTYTVDQLKDEMRISQPEKEIRQKKQFISILQTWYNQY
jgi:hypothetical protein